MLVTPDITFIGRRNPDNLSGKDLRQIMFYMDWDKRAKCTIKFKSSIDAHDCRDYLVNYIEEKLGFKVEATFIRGDILKLERRGEDTVEEVEK